MDHDVTPQEVLDVLKEQLNLIQGMKHTEARTADQARAYAVTATELEKVIAYFNVYVVAGIAPQETR